MMQAEALTVFDAVSEIVIFFIHEEKGIHISLISIRKTITDITGFFFFLHPHTDLIAMSCRLFHLIHKGRFVRSKVFELLCHLPVHFPIMGFQDPCVAKSVSIVKHLFKMLSAKPGFVRCIPDIALHIRRAASQHKIKKILFHFPFNKTERAFIICIHRIVQRNRI